MYSAVLMLALTAGSEQADFIGRNRCSGCSAACSASVSHGCSSGCSRGRLFGGHGCRSSCSASHGCSHSRVSHCSTSCSSSCSRGGLFSRFHNRCNGCAASHCSTSSGCCASTVVTPEKKPMTKPEPVKEPKKTGSISAPATIIVNLPANARLTVDGAQTTSTTERRVLVTPELEFGATYIYTMQAEIVLESGRTEAQIQQINVRGGETTTVQFQFPNGVAVR